MMRRRITLFKVFDFEVGVDPSWIILAILIAWSLSTGLFPFQYEGLPTRVYWQMGIIGALGLFLSIIVHELCHSLVARRFGIEMKGITLFLFGGVAEMGEEPPSPKAEFLIAAVGPLSSFGIALLFFLFHTLGTRTGWPDSITGVIGYLGMINALLAGFNLIPAFPLDGGRLLRSILWGSRGSLRWATRVSSQIGSAFGLFLIVIGVFRFFLGNFVGGMWLFLIGMFLQSAAKMSYQQLLTRRALEGESIERFMHREPVTVPRNLTLDRLVEDFIYKFQYKMFPVVEGERLAGCVTMKQVKEIPREEWSRRTVADLAKSCSPENTVAPGTDPVQALSIMHRNGVSRLLVVSEGRLVGVIALKDMLSFLALKVELDE